MDFDKLKKAAKETLKIMSAKEDVVIDDEDDFPEIEPEPGNQPVQEPEQKTDTGTDDDLIGSTQRIDLKTIFERFRNKSDEVITEREAEDQSSQNVVPPKPQFAQEAMDELAKTVDEIDKRTEEITIATDENTEKLTSSFSSFKAEFDSSIESIRTELAALRKLIENSDEQTSDSFNSVTAKLNNADKRTEKLTNSLSGVSKLNDSIFDLKNSQMNMRNTLGDLEESFYSLKRKMTTGVLLISIIAAVIAILEIINLLS